MEQPALPATPPTDAPARARPFLDRRRYMRAISITWLFLGALALVSGFLGTIAVPRTFQERELGPMTTILLPILLGVFWAFVFFSMGFTLRALARLEDKIDSLGGP